jgi:hypothetical protein
MTTEKTTIIGGCPIKKVEGCDRMAQKSALGALSLVTVPFRLCYW